MRILLRIAARTLGYYPLSRYKRRHLFMKNIIKLLVSTVLLAPLSACSNEHVDSCTQNLERTLKSPSSLKIIDKFVYAEAVPDTEARTKYVVPKKLWVEKGGKPGQVLVWTVHLEYDAANSFGAALRDNVFCHFVREENGGWEQVEPNMNRDPTAYLPSLDERSDAALRDSKNALEAAKAALKESEELAQH